MFPAFIDVNNDHVNDISRKVKSQKSKNQNAKKYKKRQKRENAKSAKKCQKFRSSTFQNLTPQKHRDTGLG